MYGHGFVGEMDTALVGRTPKNRVDVRSFRGKEKS